MKVIRTHVATDVEFVQEVKGLHQACSSVLWCATDNLGVNRTEANRHANAARVAFEKSQPYVLGTYRFEVRRG